jgi:hypothetical protein
MYGLESKSVSLPMLSFIRAVWDFEDNECITLMYCLKNIVIKACSTGHIMWVQECRDVKCKSPQ